MNRKGVEFTLVQVRPGWWKWQFRIGETVTTGKTQSNLLGIAAHRVQQRIDRELGKSRGLASYGIRKGRDKPADSTPQDAHPE